MRFGAEGVKMIKESELPSVKAVVLHACNVLSSVCDQAYTLRFTFAVLLLKYISDTCIRDDPREPLPPARFVVPDVARYSMLKEAQSRPGTAKRLNLALQALEDANTELSGVFRGIDFDAPTLGNSEQKDRLLPMLLDAFSVLDLSFPAHSNETSTIAIEASQNLLMFASSAGGKRGAEFFTPPELSLLIARLMQVKAGETIFDPFCGSGSTLIACNQEDGEPLDKKHRVLYGQEINGDTWALAKMNMILNGQDQYQLRLGDSLRDPQYLDASGRLEKFDILISHPPFSVRDWGADEASNDPFERFSRGVPPRSSGDYAFLSHMIASLKSGSGRMAVIVPLGVLFRGGSELQVRESLIRENLIDAVIALPTKMFSSTSAGAAILVITNNKSTDDVLFIDASRSFQAGKAQNTLRHSDLERIVSCFHERSTLNYYSKRASQSDIAANDMNLSVARYVGSPLEKNSVNIPSLRSEKASLTAELARLEAKRALLITELV
jgi:type I restriction enzyme M protein